MKLITSLTICVLLFTSCSKEEENYDFTVSRGVATFYTLIADALPNIFEVEDYIATGSPLPFCGEIELLAGDSALYPIQDDTIIYKLTYDSAGCVDYDSRIKSGSVRFFFYPDPANRDFLISFDNLRIGDFTLSGSIIVIKENYNQYDYLIKSFSFEMDHVKDELTISTDVKGRVDYEGLGTSLKLKLEDLNGKDLEGKTFKVGATADLVKSATCDYLSSGILEIKPNGLNWRTLDFGGGVCDPYARVTGGSTTLAFSVP